MPSLDFQFDSNVGSPTALGRMFEMFANSIVFLLPSVQIALAEKARHIVGIGCQRPEIEAGLCKLENISIKMN